MFFIAFIIGKGYNLDKFNHLIKEGFPMRKTVTGILLATSVLAMATVQQVQATDTGATSASATSTIKEVRYATYKNGGPVNIKDALTGSAVTAASIKNHPEIENYIYTSSREENGIMYHMYAPKATDSNTMLVLKPIRTVKTMALVMLMGTITKMVLVQTIIVAQQPIPILQ